MTEQEWLASEDPPALLDFLIYRSHPDMPWFKTPSGRKLRLWVEACRLRWPAIAARTDLSDATRLDQATHHWSGVKSAAPAAEIAALLREIVGNPFRPVALPESVTGELTVQMLAQAAYDSGKAGDGALDPLTLMALADALEEAGMPAEEDSESVVEYCDAFMYGCEEFDAMATCTHKKTRKVASRTPHPLLAHLRSAGPHYRGCFAVDLILGKS
jgi:hypothetical protein